MNESTRLELISLANEFNALGGTYFAMYLTLVSGYLAVSYLAGNELTKNQLRLVNTIFVLASIYFLWSTMSMWFGGVTLYMQSLPDSYGPSLYLTVTLNVILSIAMLIGVFASMQFMQGIRNKQQAESKN